jgi:glycosyltransferase involved in cell wall biosynthesis
MIKILLYIPDFSTALKRKDILSAHIQLPAYLMNNLDQIYDTKILTSNLTEGSCLPELIDSKKVVFMDDGVKRRDKKNLNSTPKNSYNVLLILKFLIKIISYIKKNKILIFHSFGSTKILLLSCVIKCLLPKNIKIYHNIDTDIISVNKFPYRLLFNSLDQIITSSEYSFNKISLFTNKVNLIKHGITNEIQNEKMDKKRVLFWRDPTFENGADIIENLFIGLSKKYNSIQFTIAVRPHQDNLFSRNKITASNIEYLEYPYENNISIEQLINESICIVMPFRKLSTHPQMSIVESMYNGGCVITSSIESNYEIINHGLDGFLIDPKNYEEWYNLISEIIDNPDIGIKVSQSAVKSIRTKFNWDNTVNEYQKLYNLP